MHHMQKKRLAAGFWPRFSNQIDIINHNAAMMSSIRAFKASGAPVFQHREELYAAINQRLAEAVITYLEFGVWKGASLKTWTDIHPQPGSRFYGFDSFEGLPEAWNHFSAPTVRGAFDLGGAVPQFPDSRVKLLKGWFQETLRDFLATTPLTHPLVIHNDSDLHSSTLYVLSTLDPFIQSGDILIFDEYSSPSNEFLAWEQYKRAFMRQAKCIGLSDLGTQVAFQFA